MYTCIYIHIYMYRSDVIYMNIHRSDDISINVYMFGRYKPSLFHKTLLVLLPVYPAWLYLHRPEPVHVWACAILCVCMYVLCFACAYTLCVYIVCVCVCVFVCAVFACNTLRSVVFAVWEHMLDWSVSARVCLSVCIQIVTIAPFRQHLLPNFNLLLPHH